MFRFFSLFGEGVSAVLFGVRGDVGILLRSKLGGPPTQEQ